MNPLLQNVQIQFFHLPNNGSLSHDYIWFDSTYRHAGIYKTTIQASMIPRENGEILDPAKEIKRIASGQLGVSDLTVEQVAKLPRAIVPLCRNYVLSPGMVET
jgi:hypothetical protein